MAEGKNTRLPEAPGPVGEEMSEAEIDRNLAETFPASDPPSWTLGTDHHHESPASEAEPSGQGESE